MKRIPLEGTIIKYLKVIKYLGSIDNQSMYLCECLECGKKLNISAQNLKKQISCGCIAIKAFIDANTKHGNKVGGKISVEYNAWTSMKHRCYNTNNPHYKYYGGKGVTVCERWINSFDNFLQDMGSRPGDNYSLDRFPDKNGNYSPGNCRWATIKEQNRNKSTTIFYYFNGENKLVSEWATHFNVSHKTISNKLKLGMPFLDIVSHLKSKNEKRKIS